MLKVRVIGYQDSWGEQFRLASAAIRRLIGDDLMVIHHIGSTSVPGLPSKPIIDMLAELNRFNTLDRKPHPLAALGYVALGEFGIPGRRYFRREYAGERTHHLHCFITGAFEIERHLAFRDFLRAHPEVMKEYGDLKLRLAKEHPTDIESYMDGKHAFVKGVEERALIWSRGVRSSEAQG